ncbi:DNA-binding protein [Streptococcus pyogenes]|uniref:DNA-binding protein n=1 Tax=Streptococcus pyogenes TaxID=1314 RepID=UPI00109C8D6F|nr:DNA-binding protein [Streptococcus pyogenes]VGQ81384.1 Uncharacterised protein [Streptococcus pyogenes]VHC90977.1 Uncharacterised protein [Streptococcus pyogenes]
MSKTIKELADEFGVSKTAIRNKLTEEFRSKWVQTSTAKGVKTLVITEDGVNALKSIFLGGNHTANIGTNQPQTGLQSIEFYEEEIRELRKLLDQSQQLLLNEQKKSQLLLEAKAEPSEWEKDKQELETEIERYRNSYNDAVNSASQNYAYAQSVEKQLLTVGIVAVVLFGAILVLSWIYFFR